MKKGILILFLVVVASCDLNKLDNPSALSPDKSDVGLVLNGAQINFANFFYTLGDFGLQMTRLIHFYGPTFENGLTPLSFDQSWEAAYNNLMVNTQSAIEQADSKGLFFHAGMARTLQAYTAMTLVDFFGDVPYSKALSGTDFNPPADKGADIYTAAIKLLDDARTNFGKTFTSKPNDLFYGGDASKWIALINTLQLKAYLNLRLSNAADSKTKIEALLAANLIDTPDEDFAYRYSANAINPDSRNPYFPTNYTNGASTYQTNYLMQVMRYEKSVTDPRMRYYFYRQTKKVSVFSTDQLSCITQQKPAHYNNAAWPYCYVGNINGTDEGYWGRDFGDSQGTPPDTGIRTDWGVYPVGGKFDDDSFVLVTTGDGLRGAGILPILLSSFTDFMKAESALMLSTSGSPKALLLSGVSKSISKVIGFGASVANAAFVPSPATITQYGNDVAAKYDAAVGTDAQLDVIAKEYWIALFGNGVEAYNLYRRTNGKPSLMQPPIRSAPGAFYRSFTYPSEYITRNNSATQKSSNGVRVFWDTNPEGNSKIY